MASSDLTTQEKVSVINIHIKNIRYNKFNAELTLLEENSAMSPDASAVTHSNAQIAKADAQIAALEAQIESLS